MSETNDLRQPWACPECGARAHEHGRGECRAAENVEGRCEGLICECDEDCADGHGETPADPCPNAYCFHCGWDGTMPAKPVETGAWPEWARVALDAGWRPPAGWKP